MLNQADQKWVEKVVSQIEEKMDWVSEKSRNKIPYMSKDGAHDDFSTKDGINWWTNGFWGGILWLLHAKTKNEKYARIAKISEKMLDAALEEYYGLHHDVGFMWLPTSVASYRQTGDEESRRRGVHVANLMAGRFNPVGKFIRAWNTWGDDNTGWAIIDCMMNLPLLYWASEEMADPRFKQVAMLHADTAMNTFVRPDGSVKHIVCFDPVTGEYLGNRGGQGYDENSSWTRGQSWGVYGFALSYRHTGEQRYLDTAKKIAHYFIANIPENGLIPVDFRQPKSPSWEDSTAAAITACGLLEIAEHVSEFEKDMYRNAAIRLLKALYENRCNWTKEKDFILEKCSGQYYEAEHEYHLVYGDYYFIEGIYRLTGEYFLTW